MVTQSESYPVRLDIDYPESLDRFTTFFRLIWAIPILIILALLTATGGETVVTETGNGYGRAPEGSRAGSGSRPC
jgi:hypothetical protein